METINAEEVSVADDLRANPEESEAAHKAIKEVDQIVTEEKASRSTDEETSVERAGIAVDVETASDKNNPTKKECDVAKEKRDVKIVKCATEKDKYFKFPTGNIEPVLKKESLGS